MSKINGTSPKIHNPPFSCYAFGVYGYSLAADLQSYGTRT